MINIALNDLRMIVGDRKILLLSFLLPVVLVGLFAFVYGGMSQSREEHPVELLVTDLDQTALSAKMIAKLDSLDGIHLIRLSLDEARHKVTHGASPAVLVFKQGYANSVTAGHPIPLEMEYDPARGLEMGLLQRAIMGPLMEITGTPIMRTRVIAQIREDYHDLDPAILKNIETNLDKSFSEPNFKTMFADQNPIKMTPLIPEERANWALIQAVAGTAVMMLLFSVAGVGAGLLAEREQGTLKRLLITPLNSMHILYGKLLATLILSMAQMAVVFGFAAVVFHLDLSVNPLALLLMVITTAFACSSFGIFLAAVSTSRKQVEMLSTLIILIMSAIGGSMIPLPIMPAIMQKIATISVNYWSIQGFFDIFWRQLPLVSIVPRMAVLTGIGTVLILGARLFFRRNIAKLI